MGCVGVRFVPQPPVDSPHEIAFRFYLPSAQDRMSESEVGSLCTKSCQTIAVERQN